MKELELIDLISSLEIGKSALRAAIGEDCALIEERTGKELVLSSDMMIEDIHFKLAWSGFKEIGYKLLARNLSDIAAMAAQPRFVLINIAAPEHITNHQILEIYSGMSELLEKFAVKIIGGDTSRSPDKLYLSMTIIGQIDTGKAILRSTAKVGDLIMISKTAGDAALGLECLKIGKFLDTSAVKRQLYPTPEINLANWLLSQAAVTSMIDTSDGIASDLRQILKKSSVGALINSDQIPLSDNLIEISKLLNLDSEDLALTGGEDYALLFTVNKSHSQSLIRDTQDKMKRNLYVIGEITDKVNLLELNSNGHVNICLKYGYQH